jgi:riboflavin kinase/FMN adenylyltransferase
MERVRLDTLAPRGWPEPAVTVGNFDGVHRGHQSLVAEAVAEARARSGTAVALTFDPHPSRVLSPDRAPSSLMTLDQKAEALAGLGIDRLAVLTFTFELSRESAADFARRVLRDALAAHVVVVGEGFRFGSGREGDLTLLAGLGRSLGFTVRGTKPVLHEGAPISSTRIREALARGAVAAAREMLGRRFFVDGAVVRGEGRGRTLGLPTANLAVVNETLPARGVYACWCRVLAGVPARADDAAHPAVLNIGHRPTFGGGGLSVEAHLLDFEADLYGRTLRVEFAERLREERPFPGAEALVRQVQEDVARARKMLDIVDRGPAA